MTPKWLHWPTQVSGGTFLPTAIGGFVGWFDADDSTTITATTTISNWADKSGNQGSSASQTADYSQSSTSEQPTLTSNGLNNKDVVTFQEDDYFDGRFPSGMTNASVFVVLDTDDAAFIVFSSGSSTYSAVAEDGSSSTNLSSRFGSPTHYVTGNTVSWSNRDDVHTSLSGAPCIYEAVNCNLGTFANTGGTKTHKLGGYGGSFLYSYDMAEVLVYNSALVQADREKVEGYLAHKWGLTTDLPSSHPYKSSAP